MSDFDDFKAEDPDQDGGGGFLKYCLICGCLVGLMLVVLGGGVTMWFKSMLILDSAKVEQNLANTIDCTVPSGYHGLFGVNAMGVKMSVLAPDSVTFGSGQQQNVKLMIIAFQMPPGASKQQAKQQMQMQMQQRGGAGGMQIESQETITLKVRGQDVEAEKVVGVQQGQKVIQVFTMVDKSQTDATPIFLMFSGEADGFDQTAMDAFLNSIK